MSITINIKSVMNECDGQYARTIGIILTNMKRLKRRGSYSEYAPHLNWSGGADRRHLGGALLELWNWCNKGERPGLFIPWLNMIVQLKGQDICGEGMQDKWYLPTFGTLAGYDVFCDAHATLVENALQNNLIILE